MAVRRTLAKRSVRRSSARGRQAATRWVSKVKTDSTHPPKGLFTKDADTIARSLAAKSVSPKGPGSGMRMLTYFINRAGKGLSLSRRRELQKAKRLLALRISKLKGSKHKRAA
jgi:hypothetical protein